MSQQRTAIRDFALANPIYANAVVTAYTVDDNGLKTNTKADLFAAISGSTELANPQTLDSYGKFKQPVYVEETVILTVTGLRNTPDHDTGNILGGVLFKDVVISSAEMLALHTTPKTLVAAPGAGLALAFDQAVFFLDYNSAAYAAIAGGDDINIRYTNGAGVIVGTLETTGFLDLTADSYSIVKPAAGSLILPANAPLVASLGGAITTGNSPVAARVYYNIVDLSTLLTT